MGYIWCILYCVTTDVIAGCKSASCLWGQRWPTVIVGPSCFYAQWFFPGAPLLKKRDKRETWIYHECKMCFTLSTHWSSHFTGKSLLLLCVWKCVNHRKQLLVLAGVSAHSRPSVWMLTLNKREDYCSAKKKLQTLVHKSCKMLLSSFSHKGFTRYMITQLNVQNWNKIL